MCILHSHSDFVHAERRGYRTCVRSTHARVRTERPMILERVDGRGDGADEQEKRNEITLQRLKIRFDECVCVRTCKCLCVCVSFQLSPS